MNKRLLAPFGTRATATLDRIPAQALPDDAPEIACETPTAIETG
jgi:hypothetical protein